MCHCLMEGHGQMNACQCRIEDEIAVCDKGKEGGDEVDEEIDHWHAIG